MILGKGFKHSMSELESDVADFYQILHVHKLCSILP